jgi:hypothetical protein
LIEKKKMTAFIKKLQLVIILVVSRMWEYQVE